MSKVTIFAMSPRETNMLSFILFERNIVVINSI